MRTWMLGRGCTPYAVPVFHRLCLPITGYHTVVTAVDVLLIMYPYFTGYVSPFTRYHTANRVPEVLVVLESFM